MVIQSTELIDRGRDGPFITEPFTINVQVGTRDLFAIRITMGRTSQIQTNQHDDLPTAILKGDFGKVDSAPMNVEHEAFPFVLRHEWNHV